MTMENGGHETRMELPIINVPLCTIFSSSVSVQKLEFRVIPKRSDLSRQQSNIFSKALTSDGQIVNFDTDDDIRHISNGQQPTTIYVFRTDDEQPVKRCCFPWQRHPQTGSTKREVGVFDGFLKTFTCLSDRKHLEGYLCIHLHHVSPRMNTQILSVPLITKGPISSVEIRDRVRQALKTDFNDELIYLLDGQLININEDQAFQERSIITVCAPGERRDATVDEVFRRISICSALFTPTNDFNLKRFFEYCDRNKSLRLERGELKTGLLTIVKLLNEQLPDPSWPRFTFYHLFLPAKPHVSIRSPEAIPYLAETFLQYARTMPVDRSFDEFVRCLNETLSHRLKLCPPLTDGQTVSIVCRDVFGHLLEVVASPLLLFLSPIRSYFLKLPRAKILRATAIHLSSISLIVALIGIFTFHFDLIPSLKSHRLEVYWPLGSVLSILIILHVYEFSSSHRKRYFNGNQVERMFEKAELDILEARSSPNQTQVIVFPFPTRYENALHGIADDSPDDHHPTLINISISESFLRPTKRSPLQCCHCFLHIVLIGICLASLVGHWLIPTIGRGIQFHAPSNDNPWWSSDLNHYFYLVSTVIFYGTFLGLMALSVQHYAGVLHRLQYLLLNTDLRRQGDFQSKFYFNLRRRENLEYFLHLFRQILSNADENHLFITTMTCASLLDTAFITTLIVRVFILRCTTDLLTMWCLIDVIILSVFIMIFIIIIVLINKLILADFTRDLRNFRRELSTIDPIDRQEQSIELDYLQSAIEHIDNVKDQYSVK